ncbi:nucleosome assembly protein 1;2-like [Rosa chinensis]|uniref:nucleosome assembly protein 1;2-like n=1 Tax=Rosa chinensis TaxID=74649 RepID=UPI001AD947B9|nr:nucleosome assembly protein 1;2-like [Rosa chinensis]
MKNIEVLARKITKLDEGAFQHLRNILCTETPTGFKLDFFFDSNPNFKDSVLTKTFMIIRGNKHEVTNAIGMEIEWYLGKSLTDTENGDSFFNFFKTPVANGTVSFGFVHVTRLLNLVDDEYI